MAVVQRIRDPIHSLIEFDDDDLEAALWQAIQTRPFQRLRRVKQLGFSDYVYPGASHSRLSHSRGVTFVTFAPDRDLAPGNNVILS